MARFLKLRHTQIPPLHYHGIPVVNLLPPESRLGLFQQKERLHLLAVAVLVLILVVGTAGAWKLYTDSEEDKQSLHQVTARLARGRANLNRVVKLEDTLAAVEQQKQGLQKDWEELTTQASGLLPALQEMFRSRSPEVMLKSVNVARSGQVSIQGETSNIPALLVWQERLITTPAKLRMVSMKLNEISQAARFEFTLNMKLAEGGQP